MRKIFTTLITFICLISVADFSVAKMGRKEPVAIPPEMYEIGSPFGLENYLDHPDTRIREAVVMRLGQIGGSDAIFVLLKFFENEAETKGVIDVQYGVKEAVVVALRRIGGEEAKEQILKILKDTLRFGPLAEGYQKKRYTGQAKHIIYLSLEAFSDFPDNDVISILEEVVKDQISPRNSFIAQTARKSLIKIDLKKQGIISIEDKANYLTDMLTGRGTGPGTFIRDGTNPRKTEEALKNGAIQDILIDFRTQALPYLEKSLASIPKNSPRAEAIKQIIKTVGRRSNMNIEKARKKAKNKPKEMLIPSIKGPRGSAGKNSK